MPGSASSLWDVFPGANYQPSYAFSSSGAALTLNVTNTDTVTGPVDGDGGTVPGDRDQYYTFFGSSAFSIAGTASGDFSTIYFQAKYQTDGAGTLNDVLFNGQSATSMTIGTAFEDPVTDYARQITTWVWSNVNLSEGQAFDLTWSMSQHSTFDALQLDFVAPVPEPGVVALLAIGLFFVAWRVRRAGDCR